MKTIQPVKPGFKPEKLDCLTHFKILHGEHTHMICLGTKDKQGKWQQRFYPHNNVPAIIADLAGLQDRNIYISQAGFAEEGINRERDKGRTRDNVAVLPAVFADLDNYRIDLFPHLTGMTTEDILADALQSYRWLPTPTLLARSGRGTYFIWVLEKPLTRDRLQAWQDIQEKLVEVLRTHGADMKAKDAARVLRLADTIHQETGNVVEYFRIAGKIPFDSLQKTVLEGYQSVMQRRNSKQEEPEQPEQQPQQPPKPDLVYTNRKPIKPSVIRKQFAIEDGTIKVFNLHTLAYARMLDLRTIARMRAPLTDYRKRFLYLFAVEARQFYPDQKTREKEVLQFIYSFFDNPENYAVKDVLNIISDKQKKRYFHSNRSIISMLDINPFEQYTLKTLVSGPISYQRQLRKRREAGVKPKAEYLKQQNAEYTKRKQKALELRKQGLKIKEISQVLKVDIRTVKRYLKSS